MSNFQKDGYVVIRDMKPFAFSKFHETESAALFEAERLCKAENHRFFVARVVLGWQVDPVVSPVVTPVSQISGTRRHATECEVDWYDE